jgi:ribosomal protein S18 acetylase RimI-like enzyme
MSVASQSSEEFALRKAVPADVLAIVDLINRAFAVEKFFKSGERIDAVGLTEMMKSGEFLLLESSGAMIACVFVRITGERAYAGTLAVDPLQQKSGIGRRMMRGAEDYARARDCEVLDIRIVNVRPELSEIYTKLGFVPTGIESAEVIKTATQPVHFITMSKPL